MEILNRKKIKTICVLTIFYSLNLFAAEFDPVSTDKLLSSFKTLIDISILIGTSYGLFRLLMVGREIMDEGWSVVKYKFRDVVVGMSIIIGVYYIGGAIEYIANKTFGMV